MDNSTPENNSRFAEISSQVIELMSKTRSILFGLQANEVPAAIHAGHALSNLLYQEEKKGRRKRVDRHCLYRVQTALYP